MHIVQTYKSRSFIVLQSVQQGFVFVDVLFFIFINNLPASVGCLHLSVALFKQTFWFLVLLPLGTCSCGVHTSYDSTGALVLSP